MKPINMFFAKSFCNSKNSFSSEILLISSSISYAMFGLFGIKVSKLYSNLLGSSVTFFEGALLRLLEGK